MSPKVRVAPLGQLCLGRLCSSLVAALSDDEVQNGGRVGEYLASATGEVMEELLANILGRVCLDAGTRLSCLEVLLREDVRRLDTGMLPHLYYERILEVIAEKGVGLRQLNMKGVWVSDYPAELGRLVGRLRNLNVLIIPHVADDEVLGAVVKCENLKVLDISGESAYTAKGLRSLRSDTIRVLKVGNYGKKEVCQDEGDPYELVAELIDNLPALNAICVYSYTAKALKVLLAKRKALKTKLKYLHDTNTSAEDLEAILSLCPDLESVHIASPDVDVVRRLGSLRKLNTLKLSRPHVEDLLLYLEANGPALQTLKLNISHDRPLDLASVCLLAPNLETLECFKVSLACLDPDTYFLSLRNLEILYCNVSTSNLLYLLANGPFLRRVVVGDFVSMTDGDVFRLCASCELASLEELWFSCAQALSVASVELLMRHCPLLRTIGQLNSWGVGPEDVAYLKTLIVSSNTDLTLLPEGVYAYE